MMYGDFIYIYITWKMMVFPDQIRSRLPIGPHFEAPSWAGRGAGPARRLRISWEDQRIHHEMVEKHLESGWVFGRVFIFP